MNLVLKNNSTNAINILCLRVYLSRFDKFEVVNISTLNAFPYLDKVALLVFFHKHESIFDVLANIKWLIFIKDIFGLGVQKMSFLNFALSVLEY